MLNRKFDDGAADVQLIRWYPELISDLPVGRPLTRTMLAHGLRRLAWARPVIGDWVVQALRGLLRMFEMARFRFLWRRVLGKLVYLTYWRGVARQPAIQTVSARFSTVRPGRKSRT